MLVLLAFAYYLSFIANASRKHQPIVGLSYGVNVMKFLGTPRLRHTAHRQERARVVVSERFQEDMGLPRFGDVYITRINF